MAEVIVSERPSAAVESAEETESVETTLPVAVEWTLMDEPAMAKK